MFLLQADTNNPIPGANILLEYGVIGFFCLIFGTACLYGMKLIRGKYERHLEEERNNVQKLETKNEKLQDQKDQLYERLIKRDQKPRKDDE